MEQDIVIHHSKQKLICFSLLSGLYSCLVFGVLFFLTGGFQYAYNYCLYFSCIQIIIFWTNILPIIFVCFFWFCPGGTFRFYNKFAEWWSEKCGLPIVFCGSLINVSVAFILHNNFLFEVPGWVSFGFLCSQIFLIGIFSVRYLIHLSLVYKRRNHNNVEQHIVMDAIE